jgi:hypothetical protein
MHSPIPASYAHEEMAEMGVGRQQHNRSEQLAGTVTVPFNMKNVF